MTQQQFLTMNTVSSNKEVALFTDNEQDGVGYGQTLGADRAQIRLSYRLSCPVPVGTTDFGDLIRRAQASKAQNRESLK